MSAEIVQNKFKKAGLATIIIIILYGVYDLANKVLDINHEFQKTLLIQQDECTKVNAKLAKSLDKLSETLKK